MEHVLWKLVVLLHESETGISRIDAERDRLLLANIVNDAEECFYQASKQLFEDRQLESERLSDDAPDVRTDEVSAGHDDYIHERWTHLLRGHLACRNKDAVPCSLQHQCHDSVK